MAELSLPVVRVGFPTAVPGIFDYRVPPELGRRVFPGTPVLVEVRTARMWGVAVELAPSSEHPVLKPVLDVKPGAWTGGDSLVKLYEWIADYYQCSLAKVFKPFVRKAVLESKAREIPVVHLTGVRPPQLTPRQQAALDALAGMGHSEVPCAELESLGIGTHLVNTLCRLGVLSKSKQSVVRNPVESEQRTDWEFPALTAEQAAAVARIDNEEGAPAKPFLLHGITGSGKTLVYIELARRALSRGKGAIILVPEISLTPQTVARFTVGIGDAVAVVHSRMSAGERRDSLEQVITGAKRVVIGARSAILAPLPQPGLIVVDEEHDGSYKQGEVDPRYHARDVAVMRGRKQGALVVLGSATPSMESYANALAGKYELVTLTSRFGDARLPAVEVVDMAAEHRAGNWTVASRLLHARVRETLDAQRQCVILLNRRGFSRSLVCRDCGLTYECPNCSVKLTYHRTDTALKCHQCGYSRTAPVACPRCKGAQIKYEGTGIQKAEEFLRGEFPHARIVRMDQDSTRRKGAHLAILRRFHDRQADILLGTQMVAKGLDFPGVALVGVLNADVGLGLPDFRAAERTFQLLTQVAGRAGRGDSQGRVVIQTYLPSEPAVACAQTHDYCRFYDYEIESRRRLQYPPFGKLARVVVEGPDADRVASTIGAVAATIRRFAGEGLTVLGPAPAAVYRVNMRYRYSLVVKSPRSGPLGRALVEARQSIPRLPQSMKVIFDVDPVAML